MAKVNVPDAKTHLSRLLLRVEQGEEVVIARDGKPVAKLVPLDHGHPPEPGALKGKIWMAEDFDAPLPDAFWLGEV